MLNDKNLSCRYPLKKLEDAFEKVGMLERIQTIVSTGIDNNWSVQTVMNVINREITAIEGSVSIHNQKARDCIVRRELGLDASAILTDRHYATVFNLFGPQIRD